MCPGPADPPEPPSRAPDDLPPTRADHALERRIAELEAANAALRADAERTRLILESATDYAIYTVDPEGIVTSWNTGARRLLGYDPVEILGRPAEVVFTPEDRAARVPEAELRRAAEHGRAENERWHLRKDGSQLWASGLAMPMLGDERQPAGFLIILRDRTDVQAEQKRRSLLLAELNHRVKNTLAAVQSVAAQTLRRTEDANGFRATFESRLMALARSHDMLTASGWEGATLQSMVEGTLAPWGEPKGKFRLAGPTLRLAPNAVVTINLAFHELATNAAKYGALSAPGGRVEVSWTVEPAEGGGLAAAEIVWRERGGPPVRPPERRGFGSRLIERGLSQEFGASVVLDFAPAGLECRIRLPTTERVLAS